MSFNKFLSMAGVDVIVINRTPKLDDEGNIIRNGKGRIEYDEEEIPLTARFIEKSPTTNPMMNINLEDYSAFAKFALDDIQYLKEKNYLIHEDMRYTMSKPQKKQTHYLVMLESSGA